MAFSSIVRFLSQSRLTQELVSKLEQQPALHLSGVARLPKGLVASALAQAQQRSLLVITATLEEAGRWTAQLEAMAWKTVHFYPTSESSPYEPFDPESETVWGQLQVLADLVGEAMTNPRLAIVATERVLQPHLPPVETFRSACMALRPGMTLSLAELGETLGQLGYDRVPTVETEGQWSRRGDIVDIFPVASELPVRLDWFGDELEKLRELDPSTQRSLDTLPQVFLTPTSFSPIIATALRNTPNLPLDTYLSPSDLEKLHHNQPIEGLRRFLGLAFSQPASLLDYLPDNTVVAIDELEQCRAHSDRWYEHLEEFGIRNSEFGISSEFGVRDSELVESLEFGVGAEVGDVVGGEVGTEEELGEEASSVSLELTQQRSHKVSLPKIHRRFIEALAKAQQFQLVQFSELYEDSSLNQANPKKAVTKPSSPKPQTNSKLSSHNTPQTEIPNSEPRTPNPKLSSNSERIPNSEFRTPNSLNLSSRPIPTTPHQFAKMAEVIRGERDRGFTIWLVSAQPSRTVSLLQEHDCPAQFIPNPRDYPAIDKLQTQHTPIAVKYSGLAELQGFILPTFRLVVVTDREFFGQHALTTPSYVRKRRRAVSKQVDLNKLRPGDYVVHRNHGVGRFLKLESLTLDGETREYLVLKYADGLLRVVADQVGSLSRYRGTSNHPPELNKMAGKAWEKTKSKAEKAIKKVAVDLLKLYAQRSQQLGFCFPPDQPWQQELEDSFPYQPTPDQLKATQDVKRDMESDRPMDRLVCGDVGFGKTEVAIRAIFKAIVSGKQCALLAPTTILTQQHYHTLKERFAPYPIQVGLLNRFRSATEKKDMIQRLATGELDVVVGTHQLLGKGIKFKDLGLLVVDEEQRFGVNQKEKIKSLRTQVDVLTLSATPIPRTLYMSLSGVREMSLITTPPPSRRPIQTHLSRYDLEMIRTAVSQELDRGGQVFYVVPRIEGIEESAAKIQEMVPSARLAIAHGQMPESDLEATMLAFSSGEADVLICTTIIESGLDIPRVNTILVEDAHRFGLSQLYQLRGRVGRAGIQAHAWLFYPDQSKLTDTARERLRAIQEFTQLGSGYQLAMRDMEIRGVGNLLGVEQSGQLEAIGFDLYMEMLQAAIQEIRGQKIPQVDDTQIDLSLTAFIPKDYIPELDQKMSAYRAVATANSRQDLTQIAKDWLDLYGPIPPAAQQLLKVMELKQIAKQLGFSRIKPEAKQHVILETPMEEPAWNLLKEKLPDHLRSRFVYSVGKVTVRGLGVMKAQQQVENLIDWLGRMQGAVPDNAPAYG
jgi:transcription-repair coupling factor (superfamily II helicase)